MKRLYIALLLACWVLASPAADLVADKRWMQPGFTGTTQQWQSQYGAAVEEPYDCCDNPSQAKCNTVDQKGEAIAPVINRCAGGIRQELICRLIPTL
jgi:hypothetical protein